MSDWDREEEEETEESLDTDTDVTCPYCAEQVAISVDPDGGAEQEYVEDCPVCCKPWTVQVRFDRWGWAAVHLERQ